MATRSPRIVVAGWWLRLAREQVRAYPDGLVKLGAELARIAGRPKAWHHAVLSNFGSGKTGAARELQEALCVLFRLPPPIFFPRTYAEAAQMLAVQERHDHLQFETDGEDADVHKLDHVARSAAKAEAIARRNALVHGQVSRAPARTRR